MKKTLLASLLAAAAVSAQSPATVDYRFDQVKRTVTLKNGNGQQPATAGLHAKSGDEVTTGWFSSAVIAAESHRARFEIFSSTDVRLAEGTAGVILSVERGKIRAAFDKITGNEPRVVKTPGALLAVRGTQFDVEVDRSGNTTVDVFEGVVEVQSPLTPQPLLVRAGEQSVFGMRKPPMVQPMPEDRRRNGPGQQDGGRGDRGRSGEPRTSPPQDGSRGGRGPGPGHAPGTPPPQPPPPPGRRP